MIRYLLSGLLFLICFGRSDGQDTSYYQHLLIADSLIFIQDIQNSKYNILKAKSKYEGEDRTIKAGIDFREKFVRNFTEGERPDSIAINAAEQILGDAIEQSFSNQVKVYYANYFIEVLIQERKDREYTLKILDLALNLFETGDNYGNIRDTLTLVQMLHNKGESLSELGRYEEAEVQLNKAAKIYERQAVKDSMFWAVILYNYADAVFYSRDEVRAFKILEESEKIHYEASNPNFDYLTATYGELASYYTRLGFYDKAEFYLNRSYGIFKKFTKEILAVKSVNEAEMELYYCYQFIYLYGHKSGKDFFKNDLVKAVNKLEKAESYYKKVTNRESNRIVMAAVYNYMGEVYVDLPEQEQKLKAIDFFDKATNTLNSPENYQFLLQYQFNKAKAYLNIGAFKRCLTIINNVINEAEPINDGRLAYFYTMKAHAFLREGSLSESIKLYEKVFNIIDQNETEFSLLEEIDPALFNSNAGIVDAFLIGGSGAYIKDSIAGNKETWTVALNMMTFGMKQFNENFLKSKVNDYVNTEYEKLLFGIVELQEKLDAELFTAPQLLTMSEKVNSKFLWERFQKNHQDIDLIDDDILVEERQKRQELTNLKQLFLTSKEDSLQQKMLAVENQLEKIQIRKEQLYPNYSKYGKYDFDVLQFQNKLLENDLVYKYDLANEHLLKFEISKDDIEIHNLGSFESIRKDVNLLIEATRNPNSSIDEINNSSERLYVTLVDEGSMKDMNLIVVTDDVLNYLPFDLLRSEGEYLFENNLVSYASSLSLLDFKRVNENVASVGIFAPSYDNFTLSPQQLAVRGAAYNLEGALQEAEVISSLVGGDQYLRAEASKLNFLEFGSKYDVLHLSMHSFLNDQDPELSSLVFHDGVTDNELYISELYGMNLNASLAVLSACNTGVGKEKTGEGVISMTRAFTYAGVSSVVSSLWSAPDKATKDIMSHFYKEMKSGKSKTEALRNAKVRYIEAQNVEAFKHPFYWAGFVVHGNTEPLKFVGISLLGQIGYAALACILLLAMMIGISALKNGGINQEI